MTFVTDENHNPTAFTTAVAEQAGLIIGVDYVVGTPFEDLHIANLLGDSVRLTVRVIDNIGFSTQNGKPRWSYIQIPQFVWEGLFEAQKRDVIGFMYRHEGGTAMISLFPNYNETT